MTVYSTELPLPLLGRGKVRDVYECGDHLLLVATDRLSAFDVVFEDPIPRKGQVLNQLSAHWFRRTKHIVGNHLLDPLPKECSGVELTRPELWGRASLCRRARVLPVECIVRGYLEGSAWADYQRTREVCGIRLPAGLERRSRLPQPIFTPTTKAHTGHDRPMTFQEVVDAIGIDAAEFIRAKSIELYQFAHDELLPKGIIISDTKFEFGVVEDEIIVIDEMLTPDSSRFWEAATYGGENSSAVSLDKQFVRDYVESIGWDKAPPAPRLPRPIIEETSRRYLEIFVRITGRSLDNILEE